MAEDLKLARVYLVLLALMAIGRFVVGSVAKVPYERGTWFISMVILTLLCSLLHAAFARAFLGYTILGAARLGMTLGLCSQIVILLATVLSYLAGVQSYFNHPTPLGQAEPGPVPLGQALGVRLGGLVVNTLLNGVAGAIGWAMGALLPGRPVPATPSKS
jgi:hypothetical protein